ncbi:MAG: hypothetical protein ACJ72O_02610, partial [Marmoricola sp.]
TITVDGYQPRALAVTVIVTAYADENTSIAVGTGGRTVKASGRVHQRFTLTFGVDRPPHVGEDAVAACGRTLSRELFSAGPVVAGFRRS